MKRIFWTAAIAALASSGAAAVAQDIKKTPAGSSVRAIQLECFKQFGAYYDDATKRWKMILADHQVTGISDAINNCVAQKTGRAAEPFLRWEAQPR